MEQGVTGSPRGLTARATAQAIVVHLTPCRLPVLSREAQRPESGAPRARISPCPPSRSKT